MGLQITEFGPRSCEAGDNPLRCVFRYVATLQQHIIARYWKGGDDPPSVGACNKFDLSQRRKRRKGKTMFFVGLWS